MKEHIYIYICIHIYIYIYTYAIAGPIGRVLCPEDLHDWSVLSVQVDGCYGLPEGLAQLPEDVGYSLRLLGCSFDGGHLVTPPALIITIIRILRIIDIYILATLNYFMPFC